MACSRVLREAFARTTMLVIAHRLQTTLDADAVLVLKAGSVCEFGAPAELMRNNGPFRAMIDETSNLDMSALSDGGIERSVQK